MPGHSRGNLLLNPDFRDILSAFAEERVDFIKNKKAVGRAQDIADVKRLESLESLDEEDD
jgi:hypothetical protein